MTERNCLRNGEWKKVNYYPVSIEKLQQASMREVAYFIAPVNISEDCEYFDKVKHLLIIPEPKSTEELSQELNEKIDKLITKTKNNFYASKTFAESRYEKKFDKIFDDFEYARKNGRPREKLTLFVSNDSLSANSCISPNFVIRSGAEGVGYYTTGNGYLQLLMDKKPTAVVRFFMNKLLGFRWIDV